MIVSNQWTAPSLALDLSGPSREQGWWLLAASDPEAALDEIADALEAVGLPFQRFEADRPDALITATPEDGAACVPAATWRWSDADYGRLDSLRPSIREHWPLLIWVTTPDGAAQLSRRAPNFAAFLLPTAGAWTDETMSEEDIEVHLKSLRARYGLSDGEVLARARRGELPQDADHDAWLILLGRGDLVRDPVADTE